MRDKDRLGKCSIRYARREDVEFARDKLAYLRRAELDEIAFEDITPDKSGNWLNQSTSDFAKLMPLANRETKLTKLISQEQAVFRLYSLGVVTNRDDWTYDFDADQLAQKVRAFIIEYEENRSVHGGTTFNADTLGTNIKWTRDLKRQLRKNIPNAFGEASIRKTLYRPFTNKFLYYNQNLNEMQYQMPSIFPHDTTDNNVAICFLGPGARRSFAVLATDKVPSLALFIDGTQCLPLYRYTSNGRRSRNITNWSISRINEHYRKEWGKDFEAIYPAGITDEHIFAYTYAILHNPAYREEYAVDLLREFPRLPLYPNFSQWARMG